MAFSGLQAGVEGGRGTRVHVFPLQVRASVRRRRGRLVGAAAPAHVLSLKEAPLPGGSAGERSAAAGAGPAGRGPAPP